MKIGILTYHHTTNYGATLQAYALFQTIKRYGHEVEVIDYRPYKAAIHYLNRLSPIKLRNHQLLKYKWNKRFMLFSIQAWKMRKFLVSEIDLSKQKTYTKTGLKNFSDKYDVVICGSDQIWNINSVIRGSLDSSFFLDFVDSTKTQKISYAPSFSQTKDLGKDKQLISQLISKFNHISVRDNNSLNIVKNECCKMATKVLDPTFLHNFSEFKYTPKLKRGYILLYSVKGYSSEQQNQIKTLIKSLTKQRSLLVVSLAKPNKLANLNLITVSPKEWVGYFRNASYIITNSYHGTIFSLKFRRPFTVITSLNNVKIKDLLKNLNLENRIIDRQETSLFSQQSSNIDYDRVDKSLEEKIATSKNYLMEALDIEKIATASTIAE